jgi:hypothetical protein
MRTILFRGKVLGTGEWVEGSLIISDHECYIISQVEGALSKNKGVYGYWSIDRPCSQVAPATVGEFTGLRDKNGVRVF